MSLGPACSTNFVPGKPGPHREPISINNKGSCSGAQARLKWGDPSAWASQVVPIIEVCHCLLFKTAHPLPSVIVQASAGACTSVQVCIGQRKTCGVGSLPTPQVGVPGNQIQESSLAASA